MARLSSRENPKPIVLTCIEFGERAEGNIWCDDGDICDACHEADMNAE